MNRPNLAILLIFCGTLQAGLPDDWAFHPISTATPPAVKDTKHPVDAFVRARLIAAKIDPSKPTDPATLLRRLSFDLTGLPPTAELRAKLDRDGLEKTIDSLLASPAFGERQAQWWLDLVRYAETDGFKADDKRPNAWRYRDYVIKSLNANKPYDRFVHEQIAGDELFPDDTDALTATGFLRHYPDEYNAVNLENRRQEILNDITDTMSQTMLGLTLGCAKCHDHKFDPVTQKDYYRIQAFFAGWKELNAPLTDKTSREELSKAAREWDEKTADIRKQLLEIEKPFRERFSQKRKSRFPEEYSKLMDMPADQRSPLETQIAAMVAKQVYAPDENGMFSGMKTPEKEKQAALKKQLAAYGPRPSTETVAMAFTDVGANVPPTHLLKRGNWAKKAEEIKPGFLSAFDDRTAEIPASPGQATSGRRSVLAKWLTDPKNPLTARVYVNRVWQHYFGRGIVGTSEDFGTQGDKPTHPELLDWLAGEFIRSGWDIKHIHRLIVTSATYQQSSMHRAEAAGVDPENQLLWKMNRKRLDGESVRDAVLQIAGELNPKAGGPGVFPEVPADLKATAAAWPVNADATERNRRSVYVCVKRNLRYPLFAVFDAPDRNETCSRRYTTTTAPQALMLLNDSVLIAKAKSFAAKVRKETGDNPAKQIDGAYRLALGRLPTGEERGIAESFLKESTDDRLADFCHALLNLNEFLYVD
ncbi:DUF1549 and DUF1553 domain-containing protein [Zavarzinella formosa]|uniref:DUF1549 and DUF1553 domain-containing protein n=1 Tax=Zavarzinella formosa TaxID=360055 RepID=UPI0002F8A2DF|nr:DUF1549 and DUF1553 domain-containing protein [Zavarzinella formosa]